jgi:hypothetical protein
MVVCLIAMLALSSTAMAQSHVDADHVFVAGDHEKFCGWPANNGAWQWGNEILVGYTESDFVKRESHNLRGIQHSKFARSKDGGETWSVFDPENFLDDENIQWLPAGKTRLQAPLDFEHTDFALRVFGAGYHGNDDPDGGFYYSYDRGATWQGPHKLANLNDHPEIKGKELTPRTDYIVTGPNRCLVFISVYEDFTGIPRERTSRLACIKTDDGGQSFEFVTWITPLAPEVRAIMPQTIRLANGAYVLTCRKIFNTEFHVGLVDAYVSKDNGATWQYLSRIKEMQTHSNPPALVQLDDGRLCCIYGDRDTKRMAGKYSADNGKSWGKEFIIRDDFQSVDDWADLGYPRLVQRPDGKLVAMYYWATADHPQQFIAGSIWDPASR